MGLSSSSLAARLDALTPDVDEVGYSGEMPFVVLKVNLLPAFQLGDAFLSSYAGVSFLSGVLNRPTLAHAVYAAQLMPIFVKLLLH